jgi:hypothetical protein
MTTRHFDSSTQFPTKIFLIALAFELLLVALYWLDIATNYSFQLLHGLFDLDSEGNIPAWFSSCQLFTVAISFFSCARRKGTDSRPSRVLFILAGMGALYVSSDETAQIHEKVHALIGARYIDWVPAFAAQNFFLVMVFVAVLVSIGQMLSHDALAMWTHHRRIVLLTALGVAIGLTGGMVVEALGYRIPATRPILYRVEVTIEEFMEMSGASVILLSVLHLRRRLKTQTRLLTMRRRIPDQSLGSYQAVS